MRVPDSAADRATCPVCLAMFRGGFQRCPRDGAVLEPGDHDPLIGSVLAERYVIEALLGEGGIGRVYRARHVRMSRRYAIKVPFGELAYDTKVRSRFHNEAEAASRLQHPNVIGVVDVGETPAGLLYMAMDLAEGESLAQEIDAGGPMARDQVIRVLRQIAEGLDHAHQRGLVHRDLKPENIILERIDGADRARLVDFGIAIMREDGPIGGRLTTQGMVLGTPHYMAPEQATDQPIDHRTDLFSLGLILYEMLAGVLPFEGTAIEVARKNLSATAPAISDRVPGLEVDRLLEATAFWLMQKRPADRPQSAAELVELVMLFDADPAAAAAQLRLGEVGEQGLAQGITGLPGLPVGADLIGTSHRTERVAPRRRAVWIAIAAVLLVATALLLLLGRDDPPARRAAAPPAPDAAVPVATIADAEPAEPIEHDAAIVTITPDAAVGRTGSVTGGARKPRPDAGVAPVRPPQIDAGVIEPVATEPPSQKSLTALYNQVGEQLNALVNQQGSAAAAGFKKRYLEIPYMEAIRKPDLRVDAMKRLRALAKDIGAAS